MCQGEAPVIIFHQGAFAADHQPSEFSLLGMAIKYAGLMGQGSPDNRAEPGNACRDPVGFFRPLSPL